MDCKIPCKYIFISVLIVCCVTTLIIYSTGTNNWKENVNSVKATLYPVRKNLVVILSDCANLPVPNVSQAEDSWQSVSERANIFLYSAFLDVDKVRLIGIRTQSAGTLTCQLWYINETSGRVVMKLKSAAMNAISGGPGFRPILMISVLRERSRHRLHETDLNVIEKHKSNTFLTMCLGPQLQMNFKSYVMSYGVGPRKYRVMFRYSTTYVVCDVQHPWSPFAVSIVDGKDTCRHPNNTFRVYGPRSVSAPRFNFTVCVPPVRGDYPAFHRFIEWIEINRMLGAEFFTFYNESIYNHVAQLFKIYEHEGLLEILHWNRPTKDVHYGAQIASMHDCLHRNQKRAKFTAFIDLDELIIPRKADDLTWADMFKRLPPACSYSFKSSFFVGNYTRDTKTVLNHVRRQQRIFNHQVRSKIIVKPNEINSFGVHVTYSCKKRQTIHLANTTIGMVHHYRNEGHFTEIWDNTTLKYKTRVGERVARFKLRDKV